MKKPFHLELEYPDIELNIELSEEQVGIMLIDARRETAIAVIQEVCACDEIIAITVYKWLKETSEED